MKKGFTLIELLAVVVILGIILAIAVPTIMNYIENIRKNSYIIQKQMITSAAEKYLVQYEQNVSWDNDVAGILLSELQAVDLLSDPLDDTKGGYFAGETRIMVTRTDATMGFEVTAPEELAYQFGKSMLDGAMAAGNTYLHKNGSNRFVGPDPYNWLQLGTVNGQSILWRIIRHDSEGIKIIYEGPSGGTTGRVDLDGDGSNTVQWHSSSINKWEHPVTLKAKLHNWYNNELTITNRYDYVNPINWCLGASGQGINTWDEYVPTAHYLQTECIDGNYSGGSFLGRTNDNIGIGLIQVSDYLSASNAETCVGSYWNPLNPEDNFNDQGGHCGVKDGNVTNFLRKAYTWWTFTARATHSTTMWNIHSTSRVNTSASNGSRAIRPVLNLKSDILHSGGNGTLGNPYTIQ